MAEKKDLTDVSGNSGNTPNKASQAPAVGTGEHGKDLAADPEFIALAEEFDTALNNQEPGRVKSDDAVLLDPGPSGLPSALAPSYAGKAEGGFGTKELSAATGFEPDFGPMEFSGKAAAPVEELEAVAEKFETAERQPPLPEYPKANLAFEPASSEKGPEPSVQEKEAEPSAAGPTENIPAAAALGKTSRPGVGIAQPEKKTSQPGVGTAQLEKETSQAKPGFMHFRRKGDKKPLEQETQSGANKKEPKNGQQGGRVQLPPRLAAETEAEPSFSSRLFKLLSLAGLLILSGVYLLQVLPGLQTDRLLWFSDELRQADVLRGVFEGKWLQIFLNGQLYQEAPPFYFWFLAGLHWLLGLVGLDLGTDYAKLLYIGAAVSGLLFLWATLALASCVARFDRRGVFATGCVLLSVFFLQFFFHYSSLDLFFAACIIASQVFLFKALLRERAPLLMTMGFFCAAIALLTKGALGLALPLCSALLFLLWRRRAQRLFRSDFLLGLLFALLPLFVWLGGIWASGQHAAVLQMLKEQVWVKAFGDAWHQERWWWYLAVLPAMWLPWSFLLLVLPWQRLFGHNIRAAFKSAYKGERQGLAFVWISFIGSFALLSIISSKQQIYLIPLMGPLAVLTARAVLLLSPIRSMLLQRIMAVLFFVLAVFFVLIPVYYSGTLPSFFSWLGHLNLPAWKLRINGLFPLAVIMLAAACLLIGVVKARRPESTLLILLFCATLFSYPLSTMTMPSLDAVVSSKDASVELKRYQALGYYPISFKVHSGVFSYYSGLVIPEIEDWSKLEQVVGEQRKVVVAMSLTRWKDWTLNPGFTEIMRFWMLSHEYVLLLRNTALDGSNLLEDIQRSNVEGWPAREQPAEPEPGQDLPKGPLDALTPFEPDLPGEVRPAPPSSALSPQPRPSSLSLTLEVWPEQSVPSPSGEAQPEPTVPSLSGAVRPEPLVPPLLPAEP